MQRILILKSIIGRNTLIEYESTPENIAKRDILGFREFSEWAQIWSHRYLLDIRYHLPIIGTKNQNYEKSELVCILLYTLYIYDELQ